MKKGTLVFALIITTMLVSSCAVKKDLTGNEKDELTGTWTLNYITGPRIAFDGLYPEKKPTIVFNLEKNELGGHTSCNSFGGKFTTSKNKISIENTHATMMACPGSGESVFLSTLDKVQSYKVKGDTLSFYMDEIEMMRFQKQK